MSAGEVWASLRAASRADSRAEWVAEDISEAVSLAADLASAATFSAMSSGFLSLPRRTRGSVTATRSSEDLFRRTSHVPVVDESPSLNKLSSSVGRMASEEEVVSRLDLPGECHED
jgi:uncharacterized protein (DUF58 family)